MENERGILITARQTGRTFRRLLAEAMSKDSAIIIISDHPELTSLSQASSLPRIPQVMEITNDYTLPYISKIDLRKLSEPGFFSAMSSRERRKAIRRSKS